MKRAKPSQGQCRCRAYVRFLVGDRLFCESKSVGIARQYTECTNSVKPFLRAVTVVSFLENIPGPLRGAWPKARLQPVNSTITGNAALAKRINRCSIHSSPYRDEHQGTETKRRLTRERWA